MEITSNSLKSMESTFFFIILEVYSSQSSKSFQIHCNNSKITSWAMTLTNFLRIWTWGVNSFRTTRGSGTISFSILGLHFLLLFFLLLPLLICVQIILHVREEAKKTEIEKLHLFSVSDHRVGLFKRRIHYLLVIFMFYI